MIIIIPLGGIGYRFKRMNISTPKALITVKNKEIIYHLIDNLNIGKNIELVYIPYNKEYLSFNLENRLRQRYPDVNFKFLILENNTSGAAETLKIALEHIDTDKPVLSLDCDNFYMCDIIKEWDGDNKIFYFKDVDTDPIFSYLKFDEEENIETIVEKNKISDNACCGGYGFSSSKLLLSYCNYIIDNNIKVKNEFYISGVIKEMLKNNIAFKGCEILNKNYFTLGTPENINIFNRSILFDLDGTLVKTDTVYSFVWKELLKKYNLTVDDNFFNTFIQGKSDVEFLRFLIPDISSDEINKISHEKDKLFIKKLQESNGDILISGVKEFIQKNKNSIMGVVTSCNRLSAEYILEHTHLDEYMNLLIASEDCTNHKPNPEPYNIAINKLDLDKNNTVIFEDSVSGYLSALNTNVKKVILIKNTINNELNVDKIENYVDLHIKFTDNNENKYSDELKKIFNSFPVKNIIKIENKLKTGYICDIEKYKVNIQDESKEIILKISNFDNELSKTAAKLNLYENEIYFYETISCDINVNIPTYYGLILNKGLVMENLFMYPGKFNMNLNKDITLLLRVVKDISQMHLRFYFKDSRDLTSSFKSLKKLNEITYYNVLIQKRFNIFMDKNTRLISDEIKQLFITSYHQFEINSNLLSEYPLSLCHGDLKSPNIFYRDNSTPYYLDWQYIHLNKGISDIVFLLVESIDFDEIVVDIVIKYYYTLSNYDDYNMYMRDVKSALQVFPFFVMVWFNSENSDTLLDKSFPISFMKKLMKYYSYFLSI